MTSGPDRERIEELLRASVQLGASDLHLSAFCLPTYRVHGNLKPYGDDRLSADDVAAMARSLMNARQSDAFQTQRTLDMGFSLPSEDRFRVNIYHERGHVAMAIRRLDNRFYSLEQLGLPRSLEALSRMHHGLVLVTGPTGSGKSTTLGALINSINHQRACHILTVEDPVETVYKNQRSMIHQRELYTDVPDFAQAVRAAMREDPDVILVGEMRDLETMRAALMAAETGHLVFSTLHTGDAVGVLERLIGAFPGEEQDSVRHQLSMVLRAVVAQHLLPTADGRGRVPVVEVLVVTTAVANLIRSGKSQQLLSAMESGRTQGMQTMDAALAEVVRSRSVGVETARLMARDPKMFDELLRHAPARSGGDGGRRGVDADAH